jgi:outer membrane protein assembly factor BamB
MKQVKKTLLYTFFIFAMISNLMFGQAIGSLKWCFDTKDDIYGSPAIAADGTIYIGSKNYSLYALNPDSTVYWEFQTGGTIKSSPAIAADGTIYVGSHDFKLYAVNPDGTKKWEFETGMWVQGSPAIAADGTIYIVSDDSKLYAINPDGTKNWEFDVDYNCYSTPAIGADGTIYIGSGIHHERFYAINPNGTTKWEINIGSVESSPAIGVDGTIYVGSKDKNLYAINSDGTVKWAFPTGGIIIASPVIDIEGTIYIASYDGKFYALNSDGTKKWEFQTASEMFRTATAAVGSNGVIYLGASDADLFYVKKLYAFYSDGTIKWEYISELVLDTPPAIGSDGTVYIGTGEGVFLAVRGESSGLANSAWPKFRMNSNNDGCVSPLTTIEQLGSEIPQKYSIEQNYPNPFNPNTKINFAIPEQSNVKLSVYNSIGEEIAELLNEDLTAGFHQVNFDAVNLSSGLYFYRISTANFVEIKKMMLLK